MTDAEAMTELIGDLKKCDAAAFEKLVRQFSPRLLSTATRVLGSEDEAHDAVQDALISAWKSIGSFEEKATLYTWLHRIVINACLARMRTAHFQKESTMTDQEGGISSAIEGVSAVWSDPGPNLEKRTAMRLSIESALKKVPEDLRIVLLLRDIEELTSKETAERLHINDAVVRQRLHRARTLMAEMLRPELCSGPELTCGGQLDLLLDYIDEALPADLQTPVHDHIEGCAACSRLLSGYRLTIGLPKAIAELTAIDRLDPAFVAQTMDLVTRGDISATS